MRLHVSCFLIVQVQTSKIPIDVQLLSFHTILIRELWLCGRWKSWCRRACKVRQSLCWTSNEKERLQAWTARRHVCSRRRLIAPSRNDALWSRRLRGLGLGLVTTLDCGLILLWSWVCTWSLLQLFEVVLVGWFSMCFAFLEYFTKGLICYI